MLRISQCGGSISLLPVWRQRHFGFSSPVFREFISCFLFFNLSGTPQLSCFSVPLETCRIELIPQGPTSKDASMSATFVLPLQSLCGVRTAADSVCTGSVSFSGGSRHFLSSRVWRNRCGVAHVHTYATCMFLVEVIVKQIARVLLSQL